LNIVKIRSRFYFSDDLKITEIGNISNIKTKVENITTVDNRVDG